MVEQVQVAIAGGGPVGAAAALALHARGIDVALLEARPADAAAADPRVLALSHGSRLILERIGAWRSLDAVTPIETIHVSQRGGFGRARLSAPEANLPALGYATGYADLRSALERQLHAGRVRYLAGATVTAVHSDVASASVAFEHQGRSRCFGAELLVLADGAHDGGAPVQRDYGQSAVVAQVCTEQPHGNTAYERFTEEGPAALLPHGAGFALIWTTEPQRALALAAMADAEFLDALHRHFGDRLGRFTKTGTRSCFPLSLRAAAEPASERRVLLGNAAQTLHPVAGQGLNLGLRDAWELALTIERYGLAQPSLLVRAYQRRRTLDRSGGIFFTDALVRLFSNDIAPLRLARGLGLLALDCLPPAKRLLMRSQIFGLGVALATLP